MKAPIGKTLDIGIQAYQCSKIPQIVDLNRRTILKYFLMISSFYFADLPGLSYTSNRRLHIHHTCDSSYNLIDGHPYVRHPNLIVALSEGHSMRSPNECQEVKALD